MNIIVITIIIIISMFILTIVILIAIVIIYYSWAFCESAECLKELHYRIPIAWQVTRPSGPSKAGSHNT